jgi:hypothetical protein
MESANKVAMTHNSAIWEARADLSSAMKNKMPDYIIDWYDFKLGWEESQVRMRVFKQKLNEEIAEAIRKSNQ